jgi:CRP-like cAMP-binding protein
LKFIPKVYAKSKYEDVFLNKAVRSHLLFQDLSNKEIQMIVDATEKQTISKGTKIIEQNSEAHFLQIIQEGEVKIYCESLKHSFGTLFSGDIFGETAMLYGERASKSLVAIKPTVLWRIDNESFRNIMAQSAHSRDIDIRSCLSKIPLFKSIGDQHLHKFASALTRVKFKKGERIVNKGEVGTVFYLIEEGIVKVHDIGIGDSCAVGQLLKAGGEF